jgi:hypothetical protein
MINKTMRGKSKHSKHSNLSSGECSPVKCNKSYCYRYCNRNGTIQKIRMSKLASKANFETDFDSQNKLRRKSGKTLKSNARSKSKSNSKIKSRNQIRSKSKQRGCKKQTTKKYVTRNSPPYPANECQGLKKKGNDKQLYISKKFKNSYRWVKYSH